MINKIKHLFSKLKKNNSEDLDHEDFTKDIPEFNNDEENKINLEDSKLSFKDRLDSFKVALSDKMGRFKRKKTMEIPLPKDDAPKEKKKSNLAKNKIKTPNRFSLKSLEDLFFKNQNQYKIHRSFQLITIFLIVFTVAKLTAKVLQKKVAIESLDGVSLVSLDFSRDLSPKEIQAIKLQNMFNTGKVEPSVIPTEKTPEVRTEIACTEADKKSRLPIKLINTIVLQDNIKSIASVQVRSESLFRELRVGEKINDMAKIGKIERLRLIVKNLKTGTCEAIESSAMSELNSPIRVLSKSETKAYKRNLKPIAGIKNEGNEFKIEKSFLKEKMKNIGQILTEAVGTQINNSDGSISFKITNIVPGSIFSHLGIRDGDIIQGIGGEKITDLNAVMGTFGKLSTLDQTSITVKRNGSQVVQEYKFQ